MSDTKDLIDKTGSLLLIRTDATGYVNTHILQEGSLFDVNYFFRSTIIIFADRLPLPREGSVVVSALFC